MKCLPGIQETRKCSPKETRHPQDSPGCGRGNQLDTKIAEL